MKMLQTFLSKIDYRFTYSSFSRPQRQVAFIVERLEKLLNKKSSIILVDIGGGHSPQYKPLLKKISTKYINIEINKGPEVDKVGSAYDIPLPSSSSDVVALFMVMEHLSRPLSALEECNRILKKNGLIVITTVQYWHTHNHPSDYFRYTKSGLEYLSNEAGFKIVNIWSMGGPFLVIFHAIELNIPDWLRSIYSILFYRFFDWLDWMVFKHSDSRYYSDSVGWSLIARKA